MSRLPLALIIIILALLRPALAQDGVPLPVSEVAAGVFVYQAPYTLARPTNGGAIANAGFIIGRDGVAVIDSEGSLSAGRRLLAAVRARTGLPVRYVINTHVHPDHILGNAAFLDEGAVVVGHRNLPEALAARGERYLAANRDLIGEAAFAGTRIVPPGQLVADRLVLDLGARPLVLEAWPTAHSNTDLTVYDETSGTWFLGDLLFAGHVPALDGQLAGWLKVIDRLQQRRATRAVPGHGPAYLPWPAALAPMQNYLTALQRQVRQMIGTGTTLQQAAAAAAPARSATATGPCARSSTRAMSRSSTTNWNGNDSRRRRERPGRRDGNDAPRLSRRGAARIAQT